VQVQPTGQTAPAGDFDVALTPGWHMLANPFLGPVDFSQATVTYDGATMDILSADASGIASAFAWLWDPTTGTYALAFPQSGGGSHLIPPWRGFWVFASKACTLTLMRPLSGASLQTAAVRTPASSARKGASLQVQYVVPLRVSSGGVASACYLGAADRQLLALQPPPVRAAPSITAAAPGNQAGAKYAVALAQTSPSAIIWSLTVGQLTPGQAVQVSAPDLSSLPSDRAAVLEDLAAGRVLNLRSAAAYAFTPRVGEKTRAFRLTISPQQAGQLVLTGVTVQQARGGATQMVFALSQPANCTVTVMNLAGRTVRVVEQDALRPAGSNLVLWDGRSQLGTATPSGLYLVQVEARCADGGSIRGLASLRLQR
jgi:hypothetical protein